LEEAVAGVLKAPGEDTLAVLLHAMVNGGITLDVTGSEGPHDLHVRTISSTDDRPVLPLFTSVARIQAAVASGPLAGSTISALTIPARDALLLIRTDDFAAVQFNPISQGLTVSRAHIESVLTADASPEEQ
jgi:hypothetical protein